MGTRHSKWHWAPVWSGWGSFFCSQNSVTLVLAESPGADFLPAGVSPGNTESVSQAPELPGCKKTELIAIISSH